MISLFSAGPLVFFASTGRYNRGLYWGVFAWDGGKKVGGIDKPPKVRSDTHSVVLLRHEPIIRSRPWTLLGNYLDDTATSRAGTGGLDG
jgi:hypothetical protein